ncbi:MAG TPA: histidine phosphatase family protein [Acidimicrobiales bacterium]|jgi:probable phosphoglycerate mutase|nr:histidine phosphatase family protein [Acidimicrobiales bacterium]
MSENSPRCLLVRHGQTEWSQDGRHTGRSDPVLLPEGETRARALAARLAPYATATVLTSPLRRARETAELAGLGRRAIVDPDLCEWDYGSYDGLTSAEIRDMRAGWDLFTDGTPDGEGVTDVGRRVDRVIARIRSTPGDVVIVAHAHVLRVLGARWIGLEPTGGRHFRLAPASVSELGWEREVPVINLWNSR